MYVESTWSMITHVFLLSLFEILGLQDIRNVHRVILMLYITQKLYSLVTYSLLSFVTSYRFWPWLTRQMLQVKQSMLTYPEHISSIFLCRCIAHLLCIFRMFVAWCSCALSPCMFGYVSVSSYFRLCRFLHIQIAGNYV